MCGIVGIYNYATKEPVDRALLKRMTDILSHRGPDGYGFYHDDKSGIGFGHRRLAIIDLETGHQPMTNESRSVWLICNGEIYNYKEIKADLLKRGHSFSTQSDAEVLIHAYQEFGLDFFRYLNGIYAFALWDCNKQELLIGRDHLGVKPLYFFDNGKCFVVASEIKALLLHPGYEKGIDLEAVDLHLTFRHTPAPKTLFKNISKLKPASFIRIDKSGQGPMLAYWDSPAGTETTRKLADWIPILQDSLVDAVKRQMVSDVPISLSLSSGTDSNLLLAIMSKLSRDPVNCFTIGFENNEKYDETALAKTSSGHFGGKLKGAILSSKDYQQMFNEYMWYLEEPLGNESALAYYFVAKLARENSIKVLLNGQGADELFGGYHRYIGERYRFLTMMAPRILTRPISRLINNERLRRSLYALNEPDELERFFLIYSVFLPGEKEKLYGQHLKNNVQFDNGKEYIRPFLKRLQGHSSLDRMLAIDIRFSLPDDLLLAEDKMSMEAGVEARVPFLDIEYVKLCETIPARFKIVNFGFKHIHKKYALKWLPPEFVRRKKIGFTTPMRDWLSDELAHYFWGLVDADNSFTKQFLNYDYVKEIYELHRSGSRDYKRNLFLLLSMEQWFRTFFT